jgi:3-oxoacyl-[acyl-carrier protein] reductase
MFTSLAGRGVVVTGASRGIGRGLARRFAEVGCRVLVVSRNLAEAEAVAAEIAAKGGVARAFAADVTSRRDLDAMAAAAVRDFGGIDIVCANAGIFPEAKLAEMTEADIDTVLDANLKGTILTVLACLPALKASRSGRIILTSSITGPITAYPGWSHYGASKAGQLGFMRTAAMELAPFGITVNAVMPGNTLTEGLEVLGADYQRRVIASIPLKRLGTVDDIANAALFFATNEAAYITGQGLVIDGGQVLPESGPALAEMD